MLMLYILQPLVVYALLLGGDVGLLATAQQPGDAQVGHQKLEASTADKPAPTNQRVVNSATTDPALHYPGWYGGGLYYHGKLRCKQEICSPNWRTICIGHSSGCRNKHCRWVNAPNGAVCDVRRCVQGICWQGVCMGGGPATCPAHPEQCMQYKCNARTGLCTEAWPKLDGSPCKGGSCKSGKCVPDKTACPPDPNKCSRYKFNNATAKCELEVVSCPQQPPDACKMLRCKKSTGLCTALWNRPDNTTCPGGTCKGGVCNNSTAICPAPCRNHTDDCKKWQCNPSTGACDVEVNRPDNTSCPGLEAGSTCKNGTCKPPAICPVCPVHPDDCKKFQCNPSTGACDIEVNRPDNTTCTGVDAGFTCKGGICKPAATCPICPPHPRDCWQCVCDPANGTCVEQPTPTGEPCREVSGPAACAGGGCVTWDCAPFPPADQPCMYWQWTTNISSPCILLPLPDGTNCSDGNSCTAGATCKAGNCTGAAVADGTACRDGSCNGTCSSSLCGNLTCPTP